jgi:hypothetical protein
MRCKINWKTIRRDINQAKVSRLCGRDECRASVSRDKCAGELKVPGAAPIGVSAVHGQAERQAWNRSAARRWAVAEGYIPSQSSFSDRARASHETACIFDAWRPRRASRPHDILRRSRTSRPYRITVGARRTLHLRFDDLKDPAIVPRDTDYSSVFESDVPIVVQHTRMDSRHAEISLLSTTAYGDAAYCAAVKKISDFETVCIALLLFLRPRDAAQRKHPAAHRERLPGHRA